MSKVHDVVAEYAANGRRFYSALVVVCGNKSECKQWEEQARVRCDAYDVLRRYAMGILTRHECAADLQFLLGERFSPEESYGVWYVRVMGAERA